MLECYKETRQWAGRHKQKLELGEGIHMRSDQWPKSDGHDWPAHRLGLVLEPIGKQITPIARSRSVVSKTVLSFASEWLRYIQQQLQVPVHA